LCPNNVYVKIGADTSNVMKAFKNLNSIGNGLAILKTGVLAASDTPGIFLLSNNGFTNFGADRYKKKWKQLEKLI